MGRDREGRSPEERMMKKIAESGKKEQQPRKKGIDNGGISIWS